jgi:pimeloyl-ACP methyl ester carboxylesterase
MKESTIAANGIRMRLLEAGEGPLVLLCHGFPELAYSWRHQIPTLAEAGYRVAAPDMRGYGGTGAPADQNEYSLCHLAADMVCLVAALGEKQAAIFGHDWGSVVAWTSALLRRDVFPVLGLLSVPYLPDLWSGPPPTQMMKALLAMGQMFYQLYFQEPGKAEKDLEADVRASHLSLFYGASGGIPPEHRWRALFAPSEKLLDTLPRADKLPPWLGEDELQVYVREFSRTGFRGGLNWYRNLDRDRELLGFLAGAKIQQPMLFAAGEEDAVIQMYRFAFDSLETNAPNLKQKALIPGAGHWIQQEKPAETNRLMIDFLRQEWPAEGGADDRVLSSAETR